MMLMLGGINRRPFNVGVNANSADKCTNYKTNNYSRDHGVIITTFTAFFKGMMT